MVNEYCCSTEPIVLYAVCSWLFSLSPALTQLGFSKWVHIKNHKLKILSIKMRGSKHTENDSVACFSYKTNKKKTAMKKPNAIEISSFNFCFCFKSWKKVVDTVMHANRMFMKISVVSIIVNNTELLASQLRPAPWITIILLKWL